MKFPLKKTFISIALATMPLLLVSSPASASDRISVSAPVSWVDLDLTRVEGQAALDRRIAHAAKRMCGPFLGVTLREQMDARRCLREAMADVGPQRELVILQATEARTRLTIALSR